MNNIIINRRVKTKRTTTILVGDNIQENNFFSLDFLKSISSSTIESKKKSESVEGIIVVIVFIFVAVLVVVVVLVVLVAVVVVVLVVDRLR
jgi:hypothetical protein